jgi:hypothetical protein
MTEECPLTVYFGYNIGLLLKGVDFFDDNKEDYCSPHTLSALGDLMTKDLMSPMSPDPSQFLFLPCPVASLLL